MIQASYAIVPDFFNGLLGRARRAGKKSRTLALRNFYKKNVAREIATDLLKHSVQRGQ
jgi:hypothetical protein